jgi:pyridoxine 5'-phosphate synthase PdxJ
LRIGFYINPIARLRENHASGQPDPAFAAALAESAGAQLILAGWTPGGGLLNERDILLIRELIRVDLMVVTAADETGVDSVLKFHPESVILIDPNWDGSRQGKPVSLETDSDLVQTVCSAYKAAGVPSAVLIDPSAQGVKTAARIGASGVVLDCSVYASARTEKDAEAAIDRISDAGLAASKFGLLAAAARGLNTVNIGPVAGQKYIEEIYCGQGIVSRAMTCGLDCAIRELTTTALHSRSLRG